MQLSFLLTYQLTCKMPEMGKTPHVVLSYFPYYIIWLVGDTLAVISARCGLNNVSIFPLKIQLLQPALTEHMKDK